LDLFPRTADAFFRCIAGYSDTNEFEFYQIIIYLYILAVEIDVTVKLIYSNSTKYIFAYILAGEIDV
jgi:hypothetical protein